MANSYNVTALPDYVDQHRDELIAKAVLSDDVLSKLTLITGVKGPTALNRIETDVVFGDGSTCGWNEAGSTSLSQRVLIGQPIKINMAICDKVLLDKWAAYKVRVEAGKTDRDLPFEKELVDSIIENVKSQLVQRMFDIYDGSYPDIGYWGPESEGINKEYHLYSGIFRYVWTWNEYNRPDLDNETYMGYNVAHSTSYNETAYSYLKKVAAAFPAEILGKDDLVIFCSLPMFRMFIQDLVSANLYHYDPANGENEYKLPGTNITVIGVNAYDKNPGWPTGESLVLGGSLSNFFYGTNLEDGEEIFDIWYSKDNREFRVAIEFVAGSQVAYPSEAVIGSFGAF